MASEIKVDTISEKTSANGVTIDGVSLKDSKIATANSVDSDAYVDGSIDAVHLSANSVDSDAYVDGSIDTAHIDALQVTGARLNTDVISAQTELAAEPADADEFMVSDAGVLKRIDYSLIKAVNTPFFLAYRATNWELVNATLSTVPLDTVLYQTGSTFDTSTYVWTPGEAGTYKLYATIMSASSDFDSYQMYIKTSVAGEVARTQGKMDITANCSVIRTLTSSENVFMTMYQDSGSTQTFVGGSIYTFFCGFKLIGA